MQHPATPFLHGTQRSPCSDPLGYVGPTDENFSFFGRVFRFLVSSLEPHIAGILEYFLEP